MYAGSTQIPVGTRVRITSVAIDGDDDREDLDLEGQVGEITHPFRGLMWPGVTYVAGVRLPGDQRVNLTDRDKFEVLEAAEA